MVLVRAAPPIHVKSASGFDLGSVNGMNPYNCGPIHLYVMTRYQRVFAFPHTGTPGGWNR